MADINRPTQNGYGVLERDAPAVQRKAGRFLVSPELLHELLLLPTGCEVRGLTWDHDRQTYELSVVGDALPDGCMVTPGSAIPRLSPHYKQDTGKPPEFDGWGDTSWNR